MIATNSVIVIVACLLLLATGAAGQSRNSIPTGAPALGFAAQFAGESSVPSGASADSLVYDRDAIKIESSGTGIRVVKGADRKVVATVSLFSSARLETVLAKSPRANPTRLFSLPTGCSITACSTASTTGFTDPPWKADRNNKWAINRWSN